MEQVLPCEYQEERIREQASQWFKRLHLEAPTLNRLMRSIGDFTGWKDHDQYQVAFERLLRDLK